MNLSITKTRTKIKLDAAIIQSALYQEFTSLSMGQDLTHQNYHEVYTFGNYSIGISKPGKEVYSNSIKYNSGLKGNNPYDMSPTIFEHTTKKMYDGSFEAIFKQFVKIYHSTDALHILGSILFRNSYLLDHQLIDGKWRYSPSQSAIDKIKSECAYMLDMPIEVFLYYLELIALNEDIKYKCLGYDLSKGIGRRNNLLTYVNLINVIIQKHFLDEVDFLLEFMSFAGRLTSPPSGLNPITYKKALNTFTLLK